MNNQITNSIMKASIKTYKVICRTNGNPRIGNFVNGEWCEKEWQHLSLKEANDKLFKFFKEDAEQYFANWGLAVIWSNRPRCDHQDLTCGTQDGMRCYDNGIYMWRVEEE